MKVFIAYGIMEGAWHSKRLRSALKDAGFLTTSSPDHAEVIIAHSGGCFMLPDKVPAKLILFIGIPNWPGKHPVIGTRDKIRLEAKNWWWYKKTFYNSVYLFSKPIHWHKMNNNWKAGKLPKNQDSSVLLLRNDDDTYMHNAQSQKLSKEKGWKYLQIPGQHDDLWANPKPYVEIIKQHLS